MSGSYTERFTECNVLLERIDVAIHGGGVSTDWVSVADFHRIVAMLFGGAIVNPLTVAVWQATNIAGAGAKAVTGKEITALTGADDVHWAAIEVRTEELDVDGGFDCVRIQTLNGGAGGNTYGCALFGLIPRYAPGSTVQWDEVVD